MTSSFYSLYVVKCTIGACNAIIPTFTAFQYPTILRNLGVGAGNFAAGLALVTVPYLWLLVRSSWLLEEVVFVNLLNFRNIFTYTCQ